MQSTKSTAPAASATSSTERRLQNTRILGTVIKQDDETDEEWGRRMHREIAEGLKGVDLSGRETP